MQARQAGGSASAHGSAAAPPLLHACTQTQSHKVPQKAGSWILPTYGNTDCWKDYDPGQILGKGTFGTTYLATEKATNAKYAIKVRAGCAWHVCGSRAQAFSGRRTASAPRRSRLARPQYICMHARTHALNAGHLQAQADHGRGD